MRTKIPATKLLCQLAAILALSCTFITQTTIAQTPGGTAIENRASVVFTDSDGNPFTAVSNTVTTTVANVSGLTITPDAGTRPNIVAGQTGVNFTFRVTNSGNFADQVRFLAGGASVTLTGPGVVTAAAIDVNGNGVIDAGDTDIKSNGADVLSASIAQNGHVDVIVTVTASANANSNAAINVRLGDAASGSPTFDNQPADSSANEVRTASTSSANGLREARGDISTTVENDAELRLDLTAPSGPISLGSDINYAWQVCNTGSRAAQPITLINAPLGANIGVFIMAPVPVGTALKSGQTFPAGTLYTTSPLAITPLLAVWTSTPPANLADVKRVAFNVGTSLAAGACSASINMAVTVTTTDATLPIVEIGDAFGSNNIGVPITDQSGDNVPNAGDGNANFDEGSQPGNADGNGVLKQTGLQAQGAVLLGPLGQPGATGPNSNNDDFTNRSVTAGIGNVPPGGITTAAGTLVFTNTVQNSGNANDTFALTVPTVPTGFTVEISIDGGLTYTTVQPGNGSVSLPVAFGASANFLTRVTAPAGLSVFTGFDVTIRATSTNTPSAVNDTINRLYTGFVRFDKTATVINSTGIGSATDAVPGAEIEYAITYTNVSSAGGSGNHVLTANNIVITESGNLAPSTWGTTTEHVVGASDTHSGVIVGDLAGSTLLTDTVATLGPGQSGVFKFRRRIK
ncbi:MAG TPA: hypothetical protein VN956_22505 [Pyrinomonadaceae bacterium]|nr:hypothetical protein [Pyrinomonadaceae bacterium]